MALLPSWPLSVSATASILLISCSLYIVGVAVHRLYFSRYAKFPGPKLAGLTYGYMFYYDAIGGQGQYIHKIKELHEEYKSPILRISPHELHVNDPDFYDVLFAGTNHKRDKPPTWSQAFANIDSIFGTISHEKHRVRRNALNPFFSKSSLRKLEPLIQDKIERLISVLRRYQQTGEILPLRPAFAALTSDIIADYCFGDSENYIEAPGFNAVVLETSDSLTTNMHITVQFQWLPQLMDSLPDKLVEWMLGEGMAKFNDLKRLCHRKIKQTMASVGDFRDVKYRTIFHELLESPTLPAEDKTPGRLLEEAQLLMAGGTVTTATALSSALVYLLLDSDRLKVLLGELEIAMPSISKPTREADLEQLPYLTAVIEETLRLGSGASYRLIRSAPTEVLQVGNWTVPPNTAISVHGPLIQHSPIIYPEPQAFIPERWLSPESSKLPYIPPRPPGIPQANPKYLIPFSKGTRNCIGQTLAYAELYMTLANVLRTFMTLERDEDGKVIGVKGMKLWETDRRDTDFVHDMGFPTPAVGRGNMRVAFE